MAPKVCRLPYEDNINDSKWTLGLHELIVVDSHKNR